MKYLKRFNSLSDYEEYKKNGSGDWITPNVCGIEDTGEIKVNPIMPISLCDVVYYKNNILKTISIDSWNNSLGTPIGIVVIPEGFLPDGRARMVSLKCVNSYGNITTSHSEMKWSNTSTDTSLKNYNKNPITDNISSMSNSTANGGNLPSDKFTGAQSFVDANSKYDNSSNLIPSPYLNNRAFNYAYSESSGYSNVLSDFNGLSNTQTLVGLGSDYVAANAAWKYSDGVSSTQWYLPAMGELGFLMPRFNAINEAITAVGGVVIHNGGYGINGTLAFWSSTETSSNFVCTLQTHNGYVSTSGQKTKTFYVRPFALI